MLSSYTEIPVLLFNPALHRTFIDDGIIIGNKEVKGYCILGEDGDIVDPWLFRFDLCQVFRSHCASDSGSNCATFINFIL